jgi:hypothetical protein
MKYFKLEPTYKKSLVEFYTFSRPLSDLKEDHGLHKDAKAHLIKEIGWRWGDFTIEVPETDDEIAEWLEFRDEGQYDTFYDLAVDYGLTETDEETGEEVLPSDRSVVELIQDMLLPDLDDDYIMISEDYPDAQMNSTWDGCWEDWSIRTGWTADSPVLENIDELIEEIDEAYAEEYEEGVEALGWTFDDCEYEMHCKPMITPVDENGEDIGEPMQSESDE